MQIVRAALVVAAAIAAAALAIGSERAVADETPADATSSERPAGNAAMLSIWDGVYTEAQARRGEEIYLGPCSRCHGLQLNGAPEDPDMFSTRPVAGRKFLRNWNGRSVAALFEYLRATMPENNPSYLSDREYADLIAYMLLVSGAPVGTEELRPEPAQLSAIEIR